MGDQLGAAVAHRKVGECHCELGNYHDAIHNQKQHLRIARCLGRYRYPLTSKCCVLGMHKALQFSPTNIFRCAFMFNAVHWKPLKYLLDTLYVIINRFFVVYGSVDSSGGAVFPRVMPSTMGFL